MINNCVGFIVFAPLWFFSFFAKGQVEESLQISFGSAQMEDLKLLLDEVELLLPGPAQRSEFKPYLAYEVIGKLKRQDESKTGMWLRYQSTNSEIDYFDPSLSYELDLDVRTPSIGFLYQEKILENVPLYFDIRVGLAVSFLRLEEQLESSMGIAGDNFNLISYNLSLIPGIVYQYSYKRLFVEVNPFYSFGKVGSEITLLENDSVYLTDAFGERKGVDWSGFGIGMGIGFSLNSL